MKCVIVETGNVISPFMEAPGLAFYAGSTAGAAVDDALARRGITVVRVPAAGVVPSVVGPTLVLADHTFVSDKCLGDFLAASLAGLPKQGARLALSQTPSAEFMRPVSSIAVEPFDAAGPGAKPPKAWGVEANAQGRLAYDCFVVDGVGGTSGEALLATLRATSARVVVNKRELGIPLRMPVLGDAAATRTVVPVTSTVACHLEHWVHILWLNQLAFGIRWMETVRAHKLWTAGRLLAALRWPTFPHLLKSFVRTGKNVRIHPTAHVEASILGDNVVIGARASVRSSILGDGVEVGDHATVLSSSIGNNAYVTPKTFVVWAAAYPDALLQSIKLQVSLMGRGAALSTWAGLVDAKLQGTVAVKHRGAVVSTERAFLGSCLGHGARLGAKVLLLPGRAVPNGAVITMRDDELITAIPDDLVPGVAMVRDAGTLVPLTQLMARAAQQP